MAEEKRLLTNSLFHLRSNDLGLVLTRSGYYIQPVLSELETTKTVEGRCEVENFTVGRRGYGKVCFLGVTDVVDLDLDCLGMYRTIYTTFTWMRYMDDRKVFARKISCFAGVYRIPVSKI